MSAGDGFRLPGMVDVHSHVIGPSLPDLEAPYRFGRWPSLGWRADEATIVAGGEAFRRVDGRWWSPEQPEEMMTEYGDDWPFCQVEHSLSRRGGLA